MINKYLKNILQTILRAYLLFLCALFPLYFANKKYGLLIYYKKDLLYRTSAAFAVVIGLILLAVTITNHTALKKISFTKFDLLTGISFLTVAVSYFRSIDSYQALNGAPGWFMGGKTYLILFLIYIIYSFFFHWSRWDTIILFTGPFVVLLLAVLNRFGLWFLNADHIDSMYLSTIGNINWINAFTAVVLPAGAGVYVTKVLKNKIEDILWILYLIIGYLSVLTNGSDAVFLWLTVNEYFARMRPAIRY